MPFVVINGCHGGFGYSDEVASLYLSNGGTHDKYSIEIRYDPIFVDIVKNHRNYRIRNVNSDSSKLICKEITDECYALGAFKIKEYDGWESIEYDYNKINLFRILNVLKANNVLGFNQESNIHNLISTFNLTYTI